MTEDELWEKKRKERQAKRGAQDRREKAIALFMLGLIIFGGGFGYWIYKESKKPEPTISNLPDKSAPFIPRPLPTLTRIIEREGEPHHCDKPANAYYRDHIGSWGKNPQFLFDNHQGGIVNWAGSFTGTIAVCYVVDEHGNAQNIHLLQSPGPELEKRIKEYVASSHFLAGTALINQEYHPIAVQMMDTLEFRPYHE